MRKCEEIAPLMILITMLKEQKYNLQQVAECEKFTDNSYGYDCGVRLPWILEVFKV